MKLKAIMIMLYYTATKLIVQIQQTTKATHANERIAMQGYEGEKNEHMTAKKG
jgi:hypothetical protein